MFLDSPELTKNLNSEDVTVHISKPISVKE